MKGKKIWFIALAVSLVGIIPKIIKKSVVEWPMLSVYGIYIGSCFLLFYAINTFIWLAQPRNSYAVKFGMALLCGFVLLSFIHLLLFQIQPFYITYFLNLIDTNFYSIPAVTAFRSLIIQSVAFVCISFFKNIDEKIAFQQEIDHLNNYLTQLHHHQIEQKVYKNTIITHFQDTVMPIDVADIAFFHLSNGMVFQYLFTNDKYIQNETLETFEKDLNPSIFYRANRQFLIQKKAVQKVAQIDNRKLSVILNISTPEEIVISKAKASAFIKWLET